MMRDSDWNAVRYFTPDEFEHPERMDPKLIMRLDRIRHDAGVPMHITSSYRDGDPLSHGRGLAVDVSDNTRGKPTSSRWRFRVLRAALADGCARIGVYDRHIHIDVDATLPQNVAWWGESD